MRETVNVNLVWSYIIDAFKVGVFGHAPAEVRRYFGVTYDLTRDGAPPGRPNQCVSMAMPRIEAWRNYTLYMDVGAIMETLSKHLKQRGVNLPLQRKDLRDQMSTQPYFIPGEHNYRFAGRKNPSRCWAINVNLHAQGYQMKDDAEILQSLKEADGGDWSDPRKGELFLIVEGAEKGPAA